MGKVLALEPGARAIRRELRTIYVHY